VFRPFCPNRSFLHKFTSSSPGAGQYTASMRSLIALQKSAAETAHDADAGRVRELGDICADLCLYVESLQRQLDEMKRHDIRRRAGSS
jgi:hypothetical protein